MRNAGWRYLIAVAAVIAGLGARAVEGATIVAFGTTVVPGTGTIGPVGATPSPNNDNAVASPNVIPASVFANSLGPLDLEFVVAESGGTTEYLFTSNFINLSPRAWTDFHILLGFGTGSSFVPLTPGSALDLDLPNADPTPTSSVFTLLDHQANAIHWSGGTVFPLGQGVPFAVQLAFSVDVPDGIAALHPQGLPRFTVRQVPSTTLIPEPGSLVLLGLGLTLAAVRRRVHP